jgi:hypothetical protein
MWNMESASRRSASVCHHRVVWRLEAPLGFSNTNPGVLLERLAVAYHTFKSSGTGEGRLYYLLVPGYFISSLTQLH